MSFTAVAILAEIGEISHFTSAKKDTNVVVVATARRTLVVIWHLLRGDGVYRGRRVQMFARKFVEWGWAVGEKYRCGLTKDFVLERLRQIQMNDLTHVKLRRCLTLSVRWVEVPLLIGDCGHRWCPKCSQPQQRNLTPT
jgi:hypothetical protein